MSQIISFHFNTNDPFLTYKNNSSHCSSNVPIYNDYNIKIGNEIREDKINKLSQNLYSITKNITYIFLDGTSFSWVCSFEKKEYNFFYPLNILHTGSLSASSSSPGTVSLMAYENGRRDIKIYLESI